MIAPKELRIGNCVDTIQHGWEKGIRVAGVYEGTIFFDDDEDLDPKYVNPVQITHSLLEKIGFEQKEKIGNYDTYIAFVKGNLSFNNNLGCYFKNQRIESDIKYLHQLQNLYYALTGTELEIKINDRG